MTAANSCIVLTDALPASAIAPELLKQLPQYAPLLTRYLDSCQSKLTHIDTAQSRCTALEHWVVQQAFTPPQEAKHNAALALLLAQEQKKLLPIEPNSAFWLVELVHIAPSRDGAALIGSQDLLLDSDQSAALLESAQSLCEGTPFSLHPWSDTHWQLHSDIELPPVFASSSLISRTALTDWWDQNPQLKDWRRFVNELQMLYFDHPVNTQRAQHGLPAINSLWPVGGVVPSDWPAQDLAQPLYFNQLSSAFLRQDWGNWLQEIQAIDQQLAPLLAQQPKLILSNTNSLLIAQAKPQRFWQRFFPSTPVWRQHWLVQS